MRHLSFKSLGGHRGSPERPGVRCYLALDSPWTRILSQIAPEIDRKRTDGKWGGEGGGSELIVFGNWSRVLRLRREGGEWGRGKARSVHQLRFF